MKAPIQSARLLPRTLSLVFFLLGSVSFALGARGEVTHKQSGCDYFIVATGAGYDLLEWYGGHDPDKGDILVGTFETYGMQDIYDQTADENLRVWVEDYDLSKQDALEKLVEHCE